jgi:hypothetical protein
MEKRKEHFTVSTTIVESRARAMTKADRIAHLRGHHWQRMGQSWLSPGGSGQRALYTLAAAIREQLLRDYRAALPHIDGIPVVPRKTEEAFGHDLATGRPVNHWVIDCPYCGKEHTHGAGPGHRFSHCSHLGSDPGYFIEHPAGDYEPVGSFE